MKISFKSVANFFTKGAAVINRVGDENPEAKDIVEGIIVGALIEEIGPEKVQEKIGGALAIRDQIKKVLEIAETLEAEVKKLGPMAKDLNL